MTSTPLIVKARNTFHSSLVLDNVLSMGNNGIPSNADKCNKISVEIARGIADQIFLSINFDEVPPARHSGGVGDYERLPAQSSGSLFEEAIMSFVSYTFTNMQHLRPGVWEVKRLGNISSLKTSGFVQYEHLDILSDWMKADRRLAPILGNEYMVAPDIVVYRHPYNNHELNAFTPIVDDTVCKMSDIRAAYSKKAILHASISAKWTMRSDRAQNSRTEALNLIRNRKGHLPHILVVTGEPLPSRISSLAMGTGDIDCMYHFALYELIEAVKSTQRNDIYDNLQALIEGRRLKDISDLPLDLSV